MKETIIRAYTREAEEGKYPNGLAYSVHMELVSGDGQLALNNNYGILFPKGGVNEQNVIQPRFVNNVSLAKRAVDNNYYILGEDCLADGKRNPESHNLLWCWSTQDFINYEEFGLLPVEKIGELSGLTLEELRRSDSATISESLATELINYWNPLTFCSKNGDVVTYSDGSTHKKSANYPKLGFPLTRGFGDPVILLWEDEYYYIATNDNVNDIGLYVRKAHELDDLFDEDVKMHLILDKDEKRGLIQTFWAPEFHIINSNLYILFAVSNEQWGPQCHLMKLKAGGDILNPEDWGDPVKITRAGGKKLGENGITLDMTVVKSKERYYYAWSYRENIGTAMDSGSMIMIAEFNPEKPEELITEPVCLTRPLYGFENVSGTINNEGPYAFYHNETIYLAYSGGDARGYLYIVGMLTAKDGDDLCNLEVWEKAKTPVLSFASVPGEYGPGHNSFFCDREGNWWIAFHATTSYEERVISTGIRRIHFDAKNRPRFDLARTEDFPGN